MYYISILDLPPGFNRLSKDNCKARRKTFKFWDLARLILDVLRHLFVNLKALTKRQIIQIVLMYFLVCEPVNGCHLILISIDPIKIPEMYQTVLVIRWALRPTTYFLFHQQRIGFLSWMIINHYWIPICQTCYLGSRNNSCYRRNI